MKITTLLSLALSFLLQAAYANGPAVPDYPADKVAEDIYVIHGPLAFPDAKNQGFMNNPGIVITNQGVVIVDPGGTLQSGEMVLRVAKTISKQPVVAVFNTHVHGDHWLGNQAIKAAYPDAPIYGHPKMIAAIEDGAGAEWVDMMNTLTEGKSAGTEAVAPNTAVKDGDSIAIGNKTFRIHHTGHAHTLTDIMIEVPQASTVFLGDNAFVGRLPRFDDSSIQGQIAALDSMLKRDIKVHIPGHGKTGTSTETRHFKRYMTLLWDEVKKGYDEGVADFELKDQLIPVMHDYQNWVGFDEQFGKHISIAYLQVEEADF